MTFQGVSTSLCGFGRERSVFGGMVRQALLAVSRLLLFLATLVATIGLSAPAHAQTVTVTWDEPAGTFAIIAFAEGSEISNGDSVPDGSPVQFDIIPTSGTTYSSPPNGCNISHQSLDTWTGIVTETCHVNIAVNEPIEISPSALPAATVDAPYTEAIVASGGFSPFTYTLYRGALPAGMSLASDGTLSGTPTETGSFSFRVRARNEFSHDQTRGYMLEVAGPTITLDPTALSDGKGGVAYGPVSLSASGGTAPYSFAMTAGSLPAGLTLASDGALSGTPTETGTFNFTVTATDSSTGDGPFTGSQDYSLTIAEPVITLVPTGGALPGANAGSTYSQSLTASGGTAPYRFAVTAGNPPDGLSLAADGTLSGTPVQSGSFTFTVTATDGNGFAGSSTYMLAVDAPTITLDPAALPDGEEGTAYGPVNLSASGGTGPYNFALTAGSLPDGLNLVADGTLSGTPTEGGTFTLTFTATDTDGFTGTREYAMTVEGLTLPEAQDHTLSVLAGTSGTLHLTQGATGGPFTGAAIASPAASEAGTARIEREGDAYRLHFTAASAFAGTVSLTYTLSNADGTSEPATVTIIVVARPDPSQDQEVIGLVRAQTEAAKRFARTQIGNFNRRLEQLHDEGERRRNSMSLNVGIEDSLSGGNAYAQEEPVRTSPTLGALDRATREMGYEPSSAPAQPGNLFGDLAIWTGGYVNFGTSDDGGLDLDHTLVGVSGGLDYRFTPQFTAGIGFGYGRDATDVGDNGTESRAHAISLAAYGSYRPDPAVFIDGLVGYSFMDFDSQRFVTATGDIANGERDGDQVFGSLSVGYEHRHDGLLISPYGRLEASRSTLDAFTETGGGIYSLAYGEQTIDTLSGTLGLRAEYAMAMSWGVFTPRGRLEYTHDFEGSSRASLGYADIGGLPYALDVEPFSRDHLTVGLGFDADIGETWTLGFDYRTAFGTDGDGQDHTFGLTLEASF